MEIYLVGGAVRDELLGLPVNDQDWVVVGSTPEKMLKLGFQQVGKDFPVFLHPKTHQEYALARTERKSGSGYTGFTCYAAADVTLEQDLMRRDLTINAIAQTQDGRLIDPFNGIIDIKQKKLRHVSSAFREDPLRVLRTARFAARFYYLGFSIAEETQQLMQQIVADNELELLSGERVWKETVRALAGSHPKVYFQVLKNCGALATLLPELERLFLVSDQTAKNYGVHSFEALDTAVQLSDDVTVRFAALFNQIGCGLSTQTTDSNNNNPSEGIHLVRRLCQRLKLPNEFRELAEISIRYHTTIHLIQQLSSQNILDVLNKIDVWRKPQRLQQLLLVCMAIAHKVEDSDYPQAKLWKTAFNTTQKITSRVIVAEGFQGIEIRQQLNQRRLAILAEWHESIKP